MTTTQQRAVLDVLAEDRDFVTVVQRLYESAFTGETVIRWAQGHPKVLEIPSDPVRISLDRARKSL